MVYPPTFIYGVFILRKQKSYNHKKPSPNKNNKNTSVSNHDPYVEDKAFKSRVWFKNELRSIKEKDMVMARFFEITLAVFDGYDLIQNDIADMERMIRNSFHIYFDDKYLEDVGVCLSAPNRVQINLTYTHSGKTKQEIWEMI